MRILSFLSRQPAPVMTAQEAEALRRQVATSQALSDDLARDLERLIQRVDLLSRQVRDLDARDKGVVLRGALEDDGRIVCHRAGARP